MTAALPITRCLRCTGTDDLVRGDGPVVCRGCIELLADAAANPYAMSERLLTALLQEHPGLKLSRAGYRPHELVWEWVGG